MSKENLFHTWMLAVDRVVQKTAEVSAYDLPDIDYRSAFDDNRTADDVAAEALESAGW